jgi:photosystem II stability/assembly factor-like uncharacterized protein
LVRLPRCPRLVVLGAVALVALGVVVAATRPSGSGKSLEVQASGDAKASDRPAPGEPRTIDDPRAGFGPSSTSSTAPAPSSSSSTSTTAGAPGTVTTTRPRLTPTSAPTTTTTVPACAPAKPVYAFGLLRRPDGSGWAAGGNPALQRTTAGEIWMPACLPTDAITGSGGLYGIAFAGDGRHGWTVGGSGGRPVALRTVDGGDHWLAGTLPAGIAGTLNDVEIPDGRHGWAVGLRSGNGPANAAGGVVLATTDGGTTWVTQAVPAEVGRLNRVSFADTTHGWAVGAMADGKPVLIATADGGATWTPQTLPDGIRELRDVAFVDPLQGWAVGALPIPLPLEPGQDDPGVVLTTSDGGATWARQATTAGSLWSLQAIDARTLYAGGGYGLFSSHDGGSTWDKQRFTLPALDAISFSDALHGWVTHSMFSTVCRTDDGGRTWTGSDVRAPGRGNGCAAS